MLVLLLRDGIRNEHRIVYTTQMNPKLCREVSTEIRLRHDIDGISDLVYPFKWSQLGWIICYVAAIAGPSDLCRSQFLLNSPSLELLGSGAKELTVLALGEYCGMTVRFQIPFQSSQHLLTIDRLGNNSAS